MKLARRVVLGGVAALPAAGADAGAGAAAPAAVTRAYAPSRFGQVHYRRAGTGGTPLLAFHQVPNSGQVFAPLLPLLGRAAFAPDTPGYGMSDPAPDPQAIAAYADAMEDFAGALGVRGPFDLLGYHTGAAIACELANRGRLPVRRVMLVSVPVFSPQERASFGAQTPIPFDEDGDWAREEWRRSWRWRGPGQDRGSVLRSFAEKMRPGARDRGARAIAAFDTAAAVQAVRRPLMIVRVRDDLWDATARARALRPDAAYAELPGFGHGLFDAAPARVAALARGFFA